MRGYFTLPGTYSCIPCKHCGARPVIAIVDDGEYVVKCPTDASHYQTHPGLIDIDDWNEHNSKPVNSPADVSPGILNDHFFQLNGAIVSADNAD